MAEAIGQEYKFNSARLEFEKHKGAGKPIHKHTYNTSRLKDTAILGLKGAYDSVPRNRLVEVHSKKLSKTRLKMIRTMLQEMKTRTCEDITEPKGKM